MFFSYFGIIKQPKANSGKNFKVFNLNLKYPLNVLEKPNYVLKLICYATFFNQKRRNKRRFYRT